MGIICVSLRTYFNDSELSKQLEVYREMLAVTFMVIRTFSNELTKLRPLKFNTVPECHPKPLMNLMQFLTSYQVQMKPSISKSLN